jgi:hypothetical protein
MNLERDRGVFWMEVPRLGRRNASHSSFHPPSNNMDVDKFLLSLKGMPFTYTPCKKMDKSMELLNNNIDVRI